MPISGETDKSVPRRRTDPRLVIRELLPCEKTTSAKAWHVEWHVPETEETCTMAHICLVDGAKDDGTCAVSVGILTEPLVYWSLVMAQRLDESREHAWMRGPSMCHAYDVLLSSSLGTKGQLQPFARVLRQRGLRVWCFAAAEPSEEESSASADRIEKMADELGIPHRLDIVDTTVDMFHARVQVRHRDTPNKTRWMKFVDFQ